MALLEYNEIRTGKVIVYNDEPCVVLDNHVARTQQRKPQNQVKLKSLVSGRTYNETFRSSDTAPEADVTKREAKFLFSNKGELWFCEPNDPAKRFQISKEIVGESEKFMKPNMMVDTQIRRRAGHRYKTPNQNGVPSQRRSSKYQRRHCYRRKQIGYIGKWYYNPHSSIRRNR